MAKRRAMMVGPVEVTDEISDQHAEAVEPPTPSVSIDPDIQAMIDKEDWVGVRRSLGLSVVRPTNKKNGFGVVGDVLSWEDPCACGSKWIVNRMNRLHCLLCDSVRAIG